MSNSLQIKHCKSIAHNRYQFSLVATVAGERLYAIHAAVDTTGGAVKPVEGVDVINKVLSSGLRDEFISYWLDMAQDNLDRVQSLAHQLRCMVTTKNDESVKIKSDSFSGLYFDNLERFIVFDNSMIHAPSIEGVDLQCNIHDAFDKLTHIIENIGVTPYSVHEMSVIKRIINIANTVVLDRTDSQFFYKAISLPDLLKKHGIVVSIQAENPEDKNSITFRVNGIVITRCTLEHPKNGTDIICKLLREQGIDVISPNNIIAELRSGKSSAEAVRFMNNRLDEIKSGTQNISDVDKFMSSCLKIQIVTGERSTYLNVLSKLSIHMNLGVKLHEDGGITITSVNKSYHVSDATDLLLHISPIIKKASKEIREILSDSGMVMLIHQRKEIKELRAKVLESLKGAKSTAQQN